MLECWLFDAPRRRRNAKRRALENKMKLRRQRRIFRMTVLEWERRKSWELRMKEKARKGAKKRKTKGNYANEELSHEAKQRYEEQREMKWKKIRAEKKRFNEMFKEKRANWRDYKNKKKRKKNAIPRTENKEPEANFYDVCDEYVMQRSEQGQTVKKYTSSHHYNYAFIYRNKKSFQERAEKRVFSPITRVFF